MKMEIVALGKNFYDISNQQGTNVQGANVVIYGEYEETGNKAGISVSEASIDFNEHEKLTVFPARYRTTAELVSIKNRSGKNVTSLKLSDFELLEQVEFTTVKGAKDGIK